MSYLIGKLLVGKHNPKNWQNQILKAEVSEKILKWLSLRAKIWIIFLWLACLSRLMPCTSMWPKQFWSHRRTRHKSIKMHAKASTKTKTVPVQNLFRYISFKSTMLVYLLLTHPLNQKAQLWTKKIILYVQAFLCLRSFLRLWKNNHVSRKPCC